MNRVETGNASLATLIDCKRKKIVAARYSN